jgi:hypothetical protein
MDDVPRTELDRPLQYSDKSDDDRTFASPRDDIITRYMTNKRKRVMLTLSSGMVGMTIGSFVGKVRTCSVLVVVLVVVVSLVSHLVTFSGYSP